MNDSDIDVDRQKRKMTWKLEIFMLNMDIEHDQLTLEA